MSKHATTTSTLHRAFPTSGGTAGYGRSAASNARDVCASGTSMMQPAIYKGWPPLIRACTLSTNEISVNQSPTIHSTSSTYKVAESAKLSKRTIATS